MISEPLSYVAAFIAMVLVCSSYFSGKKKTYLLLQAVGIVFLMCSYLFGGAYFAMIGMGVGLARTFTYYAYEKADRTAPVALAVLFSALTLAAYFLVNYALLKTAQTIDLAYLVSLILFAVFFRIRDLDRVRYLVLLPLALAMIYAAFSGAAIFVFISYSFEFGASVVAIIKYRGKGAENGQKTKEKKV